MPAKILDDLFKVAYGALKIGLSLPKTICDPGREGASSGDPQPTDINFALLQKIRMEQEKINTRLDFLEENLSTKPKDL